MYVSHGLSSIIFEEHVLSRFTTLIMWNQVSVQKFIEHLGSHMDCVRDYLTQIISSIIRTAPESSKQEKQLWVASFKWK